MLIPTFSLTTSRSAAAAVSVKSSRDSRFGASDGPMTDEQLAQAKTKILHVPTVLGAVVPAYNVSGVNGEIKFTPERWPGSSWARSQTGMTRRSPARNPGVKFPKDESIVVIHRSDGSGTTYIFTDYLSKVSSEWQGQAGKGTSVKWPVGLGGKGQRGCCRHGPPDARFHRIHRADLRRSEQDSHTGR